MLYFVVKYFNIRVNILISYLSFYFYFNVYDTLFISVLKKIELMIVCITVNSM